MRTTMPTFSQSFGDRLAATATDLARAARIDSDHPVLEGRDATVSMTQGPGRAGAKREGLVILSTYPSHEPISMLGYVFRSFPWMGV
jgi:hypothetical protein